MVHFFSTTSRSNLSNRDGVNVALDTSVTLDLDIGLPRANLPVVLLGDVQFALINYFDSENRTITTKFSEHAPIGGKPRLQWVGDALDVIRWGIQWHIANCDPEAEYQKILKLIADHTAQPLFTAAGDYKGTFIVQSFSADTRWTTPDGTLLKLDGTIILSEYVEPTEIIVETALQTPIAAQQKTATGSLDPPGTAVVKPAPRKSSDSVTRNK